MAGERLTELVAGMPIPFGGDRVTHVSEALAAAFRPGDRLIVVQESGELLHVPGDGRTTLASAAVARAVEAFAVMGAGRDEAISDFFDVFAHRLEEDDSWAPIAAANALDVASAKARGRSTTRLVASAKMRADMIAGLREWRDAPPSRGRPVERIEHDGWSVEQLTAPLGVVGFVFEGRPNVFADAAGVLRGGNTVVFRIGSDALGTAKAIVQHALAPALDDGRCCRTARACWSRAPSTPPAGRCSPTPGWVWRWRAARARRWRNWARVARQAGVPVSLHGTGGAWMVADETADADAVRARPSPPRSTARCATP